MPIIPFGIKTLAILSDGKTIESVNPLRTRLGKLKLLQRQVSRKVKGSSNRRKAVQKAAKIHYEIACTRKDILDKLTNYLCENYQVICIEDLNAAGMIKNQRLALSISDLGFGEFRRQLEYKTKLHGNTFIVADRWFTSSKMCSGCGQVKQALLLSEREYVCENCGQVMGRDLNAAINLRNYGLKQIGKAIPELTPVEMEALACSNTSETAVVEAGILECSQTNT